MLCLINVDGSQWSRLAVGVSKCTEAGQLSMEMKSTDARWFWSFMVTRQSTVLLTYPFLSIIRMPEKGRSSTVRTWMVL